jgi:hypothetical protein
MDQETQTDFSLSCMKYINKNDLKTFISKALRHLYYLKIIMFFLVLIFIEFKFFTQKQLFIISFIILFNIAFTQNTIQNLKSLKTINI